MTEDPSPIIVDFETRSKANLKAVGGRKYAEHPSTEVLCAVFWDCASNELLEWWPGHGRIPIDLALVLERDVIAHNGIGFDRHIWRRLGWPEPRRWIDTAECARRAGYPDASLEWLGANLLGRAKDEEGNKFTVKLSRVRPKDTKAGARRGDYYTPTIDEPTRRRVVDYCRSDVELLRDLCPILLEWDDLDFESEVLAVDHAVNDRGFVFDVELARTLLEFDAYLSDVAVDAAAQACAGTVTALGAPMGPVTAGLVRAPQQLAAALASLGAPVPNCERETIESLLRHPDPRVAALAKARLSISSIAKGKLTAGLTRVSADGRLRDTVMYYGAHTGRWSGKALQPHNLKKPTKADTLPRVAEQAQRLAPGKPTRQALDAAVETEIRALIAGDPHPKLASNHVANLLRACITAPPGFVLAVADYSSVEARGLAWAAGDEDALTGFRTPGYDPYRAIAGKLFRVDPASLAKDSFERQLGKIAELGLGYQMGPDKFRASAEDGGVDWAKLEAQGITPEKVVTLWREVHAPCVDFWHATQYAAVEACHGRPSDVGPYRWAKVGPDVWCMLPSGRPIVYHRMHTVRGRRGPELRYYGRKGVEYTYGGKLTENLIQATCRELLARAMVLAEQVGLRPVLSVHDELVCEVPEAEADDALALLEDVMCDLPDWAAGFPIGAEGFVARRYRK